MVAVGRGIRASVAAGENLTGLEQFRPLLAAGALDVVQTAAGWGVTHFLRVAALAHAYDLPVSPIGTTPLGLAARRDRRAEPHGDRAAGPRAADRAVAWTCPSRTAGSCSATAPVSA